MPSHRQILPLLFIAVSLFFSCQRELNFPVLPSEGTLSNSAGSCLPKTVAGIFVAGKATSDSNFYTGVGAGNSARRLYYCFGYYNGFSFKGNGNFADTGLVAVKLAATGTPALVDTSIFIIHYNSSQCSIAVMVQSQMPVASFTLLGAPNTCYPAIVSGTFIKDLPLGDNDIASITLQVAVAGTYTISTSEVNRYKFFGSGTVDTGVHTITLKSIGAPLAAGTDYFTVTAGGSSCTFPVVVTNPVIVSGTDYFPITLNSYWTYDNQLQSGDTIKRIITGDSNINSNQYRVMHEYDMYGGDTTLLFRKQGIDYFQYGPVDVLTVALKYIPAVMGQINFLKQPFINGDTWPSEEYVGNLFSGQPVYLQYVFYGLQSNTGITVNGYSFVNVYHVMMLPQIRSSINFPYNSTNEVVDLYYAKGVGLVYIKVIDNAGFLKKEWKIKTLDGELGKERQFAVMKYSSLNFCLLIGLVVLLEMSNGNGFLKSEYC